MWPATPAIHVVSTPLASSTPCSCLGDSKLVHIKPRFQTGPYGLAALDLVLVIMTIIATTGLTRLAHGGQLPASSSPPPALLHSSLSSTAITSSVIQALPQSRDDDACMPLNVDQCQYNWAVTTADAATIGSSSSSHNLNPGSNTNGLPSGSGRKPQEASAPGSGLQGGLPSFISVRKSAWTQLPPPPAIADVLSQIAPNLRDKDLNSTFFGPLRYYQSLTCLELAFAANNASLSPVTCPLASISGTGQPSPVAQQQAKPRPSMCPMDGVTALRTTYMCTVYAASVRDTVLRAQGGLLPNNWLDIAVYKVFPRVCPEALNLAQCSEENFVKASIPSLPNFVDPSFGGPPSPWWNTTAHYALPMLVGKANEDASPLTVTDEEDGCGLSAPRSRRLVADAAAAASAAMAGTHGTGNVALDDGPLNQRKGWTNNGAAADAPVVSGAFTYAQELDLQAKICSFGCKSEYCVRPIPTHGLSLGAIIGLVVGLAVVVMILLAATVPRCDRKVGGEDDLAVHERAAFRFWLGFLWLENAFRRCKRSRKEAVAVPREGIVSQGGRRLQQWTRRLTTRRKRSKSKGAADHDSQLGGKPATPTSTGMVVSSNSIPPSQVSSTIHVAATALASTDGTRPTRSTTPHTLSSMHALASPLGSVMVPPTPDVPVFPPPTALMRTYSSGYIDTASIPASVSVFHHVPPPPLPIPTQQRFSVTPPPPSTPPAISAGNARPTSTSQLITPGTPPLGGPSLSATRHTSDSMHIYSVLDVFGEPRVVQHAYCPQQQDEIELGQGDLVFVTNEHDNGWADGINLTRLTEGLFPLVCTTPQSSLHLCSVLVETPPGVHPFDAVGATTQCAAASSHKQPTTAVPAPKPTATSSVRATRGQLADHYPRTASLPDYLRDKARPMADRAPPAAAFTASSRAADDQASLRQHMTLREFLATQPPPSPSPASSGAGEASVEQYMDRDQGVQAYSMGLPPVMVPWFVTSQSAPLQGGIGFG